VFILPLIGAFIILEGLQHIVDPFWTWFGPPRQWPQEVMATVAVAGNPNGWGGLLALSTWEATRFHKPQMVNVWSLPLTALFLFALLHFPRFRHAFLVMVRWLWIVVRSILWDTPSALLQPLLNSASSNTSGG